MGFNIAIDGPAGAGKSTITKQIAKQLGYIYVDTGAMYRAMGLYFIREGIGAEDRDKIAEKCEGADISIEYIDGEQVVFLNGENVNTYIRTEKVGNLASATSIYPAVRAKMVSLQQKLAKKADVVMDGRDIGTCVLPNADVKIYLTADAKVRARRRFLELQEKGEECDIHKIEQDIIERDKRDMTREISPLRQAEDAVLVDSSDLTVEQVIEIIIKICKEKVR